MNEFELLKQVYYNSKFDRICDGYKFILENSTKEEREILGIEDNDLQEFILEGENYLYRVAKVKGKFKAMYISLKNFEIIRNYASFFGEK